MVFTMHSHSGQFCPGHAKDQLEDIVKHAISIGYTTMALTEHMPRYEEQDLYPEEVRRPATLLLPTRLPAQPIPRLTPGLVDDPNALAVLPPRHEAYLVEAQRLQALYAPQIHILIGFEGEFIRPAFTAYVQNLTTPAVIDFFIGSVHHVHSTPIDFDHKYYAAAVAAASPATEEQLYEDYYDLQHEMLRSLRPRVVGHFDLIRLMSEQPGRDVRSWPGVWAKIVRNLKLAKEVGAWLECNSSALRKGLDDPYPCRPIAEEWIRIGGKFTMSDDSHGIAQVATNYSRALAYLNSLDVKEVWTLRRAPHPGTSGDAKSKLEDVSVPLTAFQQAFPFS
ncbi:unnamed protein product [Clonostachys rhizophaga]|uniref:Histidinol-phosphatase n=1 Tax=Clonostachys rhizophaga TaxID=160324 RepID=A0A9N9VQ99_9HYPO|nr:unnamed protein product [Clonostachys rhizophaga]